MNRKQARAGIVAAVREWEGTPYLRQVPPSLSSDDLLDGTPVHAVPLAQWFQRNAAGMFRSHLSNEALGEFGVAVKRPRMHPAFFLGIRHIVRVGPEKKMIRANTAWIIAFMADIQSCGYWTVMEFPRDAMSQRFVAPISPTPEKFTIAFAHKGSVPKPTCIGLLNPRPKSFFKRGIRTTGDDGTIEGHHNLPCCGVMPPEVTASRGLRAAYCNRTEHER